MAFRTQRRVSTSYRAYRGGVIHDLRRTARTHFSALPVQDMIRELVIAQ
jgi:hypothetical protein